jgi:hypothetical protein
VSIGLARGFGCELGNGVTMVLPQGSSIITRLVPLSVFSAALGLVGARIESCVMPAGLVARKRGSSQYAARARRSAPQCVFWRERCLRFDVDVSTKN